MLTELDLAALVADIGPLLLAGSFVSGLMCWRDLDVEVLARWPGHLHRRHRGRRPHPRQFANWLARHGLPQT